jgi:hypothetical protein
MEGIIWTDVINAGVLQKVKGEGMFYKQLKTKANSIGQILQGTAF